MVPAMSQAPSSPASEPSEHGSGRKAGFWFPITVIVLAVLALVALEVIDSAEWAWPVASAMARFLTPFLARVIAVGLAAILLFCWFVFFAPVARSARVGVAVLALALMVVLGATFKIEGYTGDIRPRVRLRWASEVALPQATEGTADLAATSPDDYPEFLGPGRRATLANAHLARDWSTEPPKQLWRQPIGEGWSGFAVVGQYAVTQEQRGDEELVTCYEVATGKLRWAHATPVRFFAALAGVGPRATPTIHEGKVYALGAMGHLVCLDGASGKPVWQHQILKENRAMLPQWGKSCSPLVYQNAVIVSAGGGEGKSLVAYDKNDGKPLWSAGDDASSYSSPTAVTLGGQPQILIVNARVVTAHDPSDGQVLWQREWPGDDVPSPSISQPIAVGDDRVLMCKGYGVGSALWQIKRDGDAWSVEQIWRNNNLKTKMTNAVVRDGFAYGLDEGILSCIDIANGAKKWKKGKYGHGQVLRVDDLLLVQSERGDVALVEANPKAYRELTRFSAISGQSWNYPALSGNRLLVRSDQEAACYELPRASP
jgi:outer membrane protein assembly factor BamB